MRKDVRRLWVSLALWGAVIVTQFLAWRLARSEGDGEAHGMANVVMLLWVLHLIVGWVLVPQLIHEDPLIGDQAGWRVRPIAGARLLAAKLLGWRCCCGCGHRC